MKIGILFCGRVLTFESCFPSYKKYVLDSLQKQGHEIYSFLSHNAINKTDNVDEFIQTYSIIAHESTLYETPWLDTFSFNETHTKQNIRMYYHEHRAFALLQKENGFQFDCVILLRADELFHQDFVLPTSLPENTVFIPNGHDWDGINDQIAYGDYASMKKYCSLIENLDTIQEKLNTKKFNPEVALKKHLELQNLHVVRFSLAYELHKNRFPSGLKNGIHL